jgi:uncharacterized protein (DUF2062 family)
MREFFHRRLVQPLLSLLKQGVTPRKLALSVALGAVMGIVPVMGVSTAVCAILAILLRLNMPAIQLVNYLMLPLQLLLIIPFLRFGEWLVRAPAYPVTLESGLALLSHGVISAVKILAVAIFHATLGWIVVAPLLAFALAKIIEPVLRHLAPISFQGAR